MSKSEIEMWRLNIENSAATVCNQYGQDVACSVFNRYDAHNIDDLSPIYYSDVFGELEQILND